MIKASSVSIENLLGNNNESIEQRYSIPPYQRAYSWNKDQWEQIINDIIENDNGYFIGSILLIDKTYNETENIKNYEVIDGQQRLSTLSALLIAIYCNLLVELSENPSSDEDISEFRLDLRYLIIGTRKKRINRLTLSSQENNYTHYSQILDEVAKLSNEPNLTYESIKNNYFQESDYENKSNILEVIKYYQNMVRKTLDSLDDDMKINKLIELYDKIKMTKLVRIEVSDEASAYTIFESLNDRGTPLSPMDLIKNKIISEIIKTNSNDTITPESINNKWNTITKNIKKSEEQFRFLKHYYYSFIINNNSEKLKKITKSNVIPVYFDIIKKSNNKIELLEDMISKSKIYNNIINPQNINSKNLDNKYLTSYKDYLIGLNKVKAAPSHSLLLFLLSKFRDTNIEKLIQFIEIWFIRRHLENNPQTNKLDNIFIEIIQSIKTSTKLDISEIIFKLNGYFDKVKESEIIDRYLKIPVFKENKDATRVMLTRIEQNLSNKQQCTRDFWHKTWTIEHVLPQNIILKNESNEDLSHWNTLYSEDEHKKWVHTLGNLTLSSLPYNSEMSRKKFKDKCELYESKDLDDDSNNEDIDNFTGLMSELKINQSFRDSYNNKKDWTPAELQSRGIVLTKTFINIYKSFNETDVSFFD